MSQTAHLTSLDGDEKRLNLFVADQAADDFVHHVHVAAVGATARAPLADTTAICKEMNSNVLSVPVPVAVAVAVAVAVPPLVPV